MALTENTLREFTLTSSQPLRPVNYILLIVRLAKRILIIISSLKKPPRYLTNAYLGMIIKQLGQGRDGGSVCHLYSSCTCSRPEFESI